MSAPLAFFSGAPVAQTLCATGEFCLKENPAAHWRATAPLPVAQAQQAGLFHHGQNPRQRRIAARQHFMEGNMKNENAEIVVSNNGGEFQVYRWADERRDAGMMLVETSSIQVALDTADKNAAEHGGKVVLS